MVGDNIEDTILASTEVPSVELWMAFRDAFSNLKKVNETLKSEVVEGKRAMQSGMASSMNDDEVALVRAASKSTFAPSIVGGASSGSNPLKKGMSISSMRKSSKSKMSAE